MWDVAALKHAVQTLCGMLNKHKIPDSSVVQAFQVEAKKGKIEKKVHPASETVGPMSTTRQEALLRSGKKQIQ